MQKFKSSGNHLVSFYAIKCLKTAILSVSWVLLSKIAGNDLRTDRKRVSGPKTNIYQTFVITGGL